MVLYVPRYIFVCIANKYFCVCIILELTLKYVCVGVCACNINDARD